jgi:hypothetical protein
VCCRSWRPGCHDVSQDTERHSFIFSPFRALSFLSCPWARHSLWTQTCCGINLPCSGTRQSTHPQLNLRIWFVCINYSFFNFGAFSCASKSRISTSYIKRKVDVHVQYITPPPPGELCFPDNISFSFCGKALVATYPAHKTDGSLCVISGFHREAHKICAVLGYYAAYSGNFLPTLRDNLSVSSSKANKLKIWILNSWRSDHYVVPKRR